jgi:hypothetical protein
MKKELQIINIDGTEGSGKSTQIGMLAAHFRMAGINVKINRMEDNIESAIHCAEDTEEFLQENPDGVVINDGSIARMMVVDLVKGITQPKVVDKHKEIIHLHEVMNHKYGVANILFVMEDLEECNRRLKRESDLLHNSSYKTINPKVEGVVVNGIRAFDDNVVTQNMKFHVFEIDKEDSILDIKKALIKYLEESFKFKKTPVKSGAYYD